MSSKLFLIVIVSLVFGFTVRLEGQSLDGIPMDARVIDEAKDRKKKVDSEQFTMVYGAELRNTSSGETIDGIKVRIITFRVPHDFNRKDTGHRVSKVVLQENISLLPSETKRLEFGSEDFANSITRTKSGDVLTITARGDEYAGIVMEIYIKDILVGVRFSGNSQMRKAYDAWPGHGDPKSQVEPSVAGAGGRPVPVQ